MHACTTEQTPHPTPFQSLSIQACISLACNYGIGIWTDGRTDGWMDGWMGGDWTWIGTGMVLWMDKWDEGMNKMCV